MTNAKGSTPAEETAVSGMTASRGPAQTGEQEPSTGSSARFAAQPVRWLVSQQEMPGPAADVTVALTPAPAYPVQACVNPIAAISSVTIQRNGMNVRAPIRLVRVPAGYYGRVFEAEFILPGITGRKQPNMRVGTGVSLSAPVIGWALGTNRCSPRGAPLQRRAAHSLLRTRASSPRRRTAFPARSWGAIRCGASRRNRRRRREARR